MPLEFVFVHVKEHHLAFELVNTLRLLFDLHQVSLGFLLLHVTLELHLSQLGFALLRLLGQLLFSLFGFFGQDLVRLILEFSMMALFFHFKVELLDHFVLLGVL